MRLTLLAPDIVVTILNGRQPAGLNQKQLMKLFPVEWDKQRIHFLDSGHREVE